jgi:hypothetical protein
MNAKNRNPMPKNPPGFLITSGNSKRFKSPSHNQGVAGVYPAGLILNIKYLQGSLVVVVFFMPRSY